jgi:hypothetical protein
MMRTCSRTTGEIGNLLIKIGVKIFNALNNRQYGD